MKPQLGRNNLSGRALARAIARAPKENRAKKQMHDRLSRTLQSTADRKSAAILRTNKQPFSNPANFPRIAMVFQPLEDMLTRLVETGENDALPDGTPIMWFEAAGHWSPIAPALESMCETFSKLAKTHGWTDETEGLRQFGKRLELDMPTFQADVDRARVTLRWMREQILLITPEQFSAEAIEVQIRNEIHGIQG